MSLKRAWPNHARLKAAAGATIVLALGASTAAYASTGSSPVARTSAGSSIPLGIFEPEAASVGGFGVPTVKGAELAVKQINAAGGINGHPLTLDSQDDACTSEGGVTAVQKLLSADPKPVALLGGFCSDSVLAVLPTLERDQIPLLIDDASTTSITQDELGPKKDDWAFRWGASDAQTATASVDFFGKLGGIKTAAIVTSNDSFGEGLKSLAPGLLKAKGIKVLSSDAVDLSSPDFAPVIAKIKAEKPDVVFVWMNTSPSQTAFYKQYAQAGLKNVLLGGDVNLSEAPIDADGLKGYASGLYSTSESTPGNRAYLKAWKASGETVSTAFDGYVGYEGVKVMAAALKQAKAYTPSAVRDALASLNYSPTINEGTVKFDAHNQAHDNVAIVKFVGSHDSTSLIKGSLLP